MLTLCRWLDGDMNIYSAGEEVLCADSTVSSHFVTLIAPHSRGVFILFKHGQRWGDVNLVWLSSLYMHLNESVYIAAV